MSDATLPPDAKIEPTREVLRRIYTGFGKMSFSDAEPKILARAKVLAQQGWLVQDGPSYPSTGLHWTRFNAAEKLDVRALKDL